MSYLVPSASEGITFSYPFELYGRSEFSVAVTIRLLALPPSGFNRILVGDYAGAVSSREFNFALNASAVNAIMYNVAHAAINAQTAAGFVRIGLNRLVWQFWNDPDFARFNIWNNEVLFQATAATGQALNPDPNVLLGIASPAASTLGVPGVYSEVAIWGSRIPDSMALDYQRGVSPLAWPRDLLFHAPLTHNPHDVRRGRKGTFVGAPYFVSAGLSDLAAPAPPWAQPDVPVRSQYLQALGVSGGVAPTFPALTLAP